MAKKQRTGDDKRAGSGRPDELEAGETGPERPAGAGDRTAGEGAPAGRPAVPPQSLERLRRKLKAKYH
jgi:hypothetical protein